MEEDETEKTIEWNELVDRCFRGLWFVKCFSPGPYMRHIELISEDPRSQKHEARFFFENWLSIDDMAEMISLIG